MPTAKKRKPTSRTFNAAAHSTRPAGSAKGVKIDWSSAVVTPGGGVAATIAAIRRTRGPGRKPAKEQVAIRLDPEVLRAFRAGGPGWQTRMNAALREWLTAHPVERKLRSHRAA